METEHSVSISVTAGQNLVIDTAVNPAVKKNEYPPSLRVKEDKNTDIMLTTSHSNVPTGQGKYGH